jgi:hypothetical protein
LHLVGLFELNKSPNFWSFASAEILLPHLQVSTTDPYTGWVFRVYKLTSYVLKTHFNIILLSRHRCSDRSLSFGFSYYNLYTFLIAPISATLPSYFNFICLQIINYKTPHWPVAIKSWVPTWLSQINLDSFSHRTT